MTLIDTAQLLGNFGEFVGAIAVVATLGYLAVQVRQSRRATDANTNALRSSTYTAYLENANAWCQLAGEHAADLAVIGQLSDLDQLNEEQTILWQAYLFSTFNQWEVTFLHYRADSIDRDVYEAKVRAFKAYIDWPVTGGLLRQSWEQNKFGFTEEFQRFMDVEVMGGQNGGILTAQGI